MKDYEGPELQSKICNLPCFNEKIQVICNQHINCMQMYVVKSALKQQFSLIKLSLCSLHFDYIICLLHRTNVKPLVISIIREILS